MFINSEYVFFPSLMILVLGIIILNYYTKNIKLAFLVSLLKASIFYIYFSYFFDGSMTLSDDWKYLNNAYSLWVKEYSYLYLFENIEELYYIAAGPHMLYYLYNIVSFDLFGPYYYSPVALNTILTFITSYYLYLIALKFLSIKNSKYVALFFVLHWDILTWGNFFNLKAMLVQLLTIVLVYNLMILSKKNILKPFIIVVTITFLFGFLRFYVPVLIIGGYLIYLYIVSYKRITLLKKIISIVSVVVFVASVFSYVSELYLYEINRFVEGMTNPVYGTFRFLLTPVPFMMDDEYSFLVLSTFLHWLTFPLMLAGVYYIYKKNKTVTFFLMSVIITIILFYGFYAELQGPRHRLIIVPYLALLQYSGFIFLYKKLSWNTDAR